MQVIKTIKDIRALNRKLKLEGRTIGFIPTMGALHEGHLSLIRRSRDESDVTVVSIFVNPTQFAVGEDFNRYPRDIEGDLKKLSSLKVDAVFTPDDGEMYPDGFSTSVDVGDIGKILCGASRPGHFNGVATVVAKFFNIVMPDKAYFGQKDYQQAVIVKKLVKELNLDIDIIVCPTVREPDGLAMSSRNIYLSQEERRAAAVLYRTLRRAEELIIHRGLKEASYIKGEMVKLMKSESHVNIDYVALVNPRNIETVKKIELPVVICLAVKIGDTRLIDNIIVDKT